jgi:pectinesterase inhibitor-like protein
VDVLTANAISTTDKIKGLIGGEAADAMKQCLLTCQALYDNILQRQAGCAVALKDGRLNEVSSSLEKAASAAKECEDTFRRAMSPHH